MQFELSPCGPGLAEDRLRQERRDDPVRRVDDFADAEVCRDARDDIGLLAREPVLRHQVLDQVADGLLGRQEEVGAVGRRCELRTAARLGSGGPELGLAKRAPLAEPHPERDAGRHLDGTDADLAVALGAVGVTDGQEAAVDPYREVERRPRR